MQRLLTPRTIAIVGLSGDPTKHGARVVANLRKLGFAGEVWGVNPKLPDVEGIRVYRSVEELPSPPDVVVLAVPAAVAPSVIGAAGGSGCAIVFAGGFAEAGPEGKALQDELVATGRRTGVRVLGPNSGGVIVPAAGVALSFLTCLDRPAEQIRPGPVGLVTQSGGTGSYIHNLAAATGSGLAASISTGNEADLGIADGIIALTELPGVRVIALIVETVRDGPAFVEAIRRATAAGKPVVMTRIGTSRRGRAMTESHTGALASPARVIEGVCATLGVTLAETPAEMLEIAEILARSSRPRGPRAGIVTHSGGIAILLSDLAERTGLRLPPPTPELERFLIPRLQQGSAGNPLDMGGIMGGPERFGEVVGGFAGEYDVVLAVSTAHPPAHTEARVDALLALDTPTPVVHLWMAGDVGSHGLERLRTAHRPVTEEPRAAIRALAALTQPSPVDRPEGLPPSAQPLPDHPVTEAIAKDILRSWGIPTPDGAVVESAADAVRVADRLGYPVVAKISSKWLTHKTDIGGVLTGLPDAEAVAGAFEKLRAAAAGLETDGVLIERMAAAGPEVVVGTIRDRVFGPMVMVGLGGIWTEALDDVAMAPAPISRDGARCLVERLRGRRALIEPRQGPPADLDELASIISRVSTGFGETPATAIEINPLAWIGDRWQALDAVLSRSS